MRKLFLLSILFSSSFFAQNINLSGGYKTVELGLTHTLESEILLGGSIAMTDTKVIVSRANIADVGSYLHKENTKYTPTVFGLIGGKFNRIHVLGKLGLTYLDQSICKINDSRQTDGTFIKDSRHLYVAMGFQASYYITDRFGINGGFDNVNSGTLGINFKL